MDTKVVDDFREAHKQAVARRDALLEELAALNELLGPLKPTPGARKRGRPAGSRNKIAAGPAPE